MAGFFSTVSSVLGAVAGTVGDFFGSDIGGRILGAGASALGSIGGEDGESRGPQPSSVLKTIPQEPTKALPPAGTGKAAQITSYQEVRNFWMSLMLEGRQAPVDVRSRER